MLILEYLEYLYIIVWNYFCCPAEIMFGEYILGSGMENV